MSTRKKIQWRLGVVAALAVAAIALYPQARFCLERASDWQGSYAVAQADEPVYAAYLNALIEGRPRRTDPLNDREATPTGAPLPESYFSIQFVPAYALALPARALGLTTTQVFMLLPPLAAALTTLTLFWLITLVTRDERLAAAGALCVLCFGTLAAGQGVGRLLIGVRTWYDYFPFIRRYQPAPAFPLFFIFCGCAWLALVLDARRARRHAWLAGLAFALLVFSYFYLWTAAAAWFACLALVWLVARRGTLRKLTTRLAPTVALALAALVPYALLMARRVASTDQVLMLEYTRAPDLFRVPELIGAGVLCALWLGARRGRLFWPEGGVLFAAASALTPFAVFNQQLLTGRSLQPLHYEQFIANYAALLACVTAAPLLRRLRRPLPAHHLRIAALLACVWGLLEVGVTTHAFRAYNFEHDYAVPVARLVRLETDTPRGDGARNAFNARSARTVFTPNVPLANNLPTYGVPVLWGTHTPNFPGINAAECRERAFRHYYFSGVTPDELRRLLTAEQFDAVNAVFGLERAVPVLTAHPTPLSASEIERAATEYAAYYAAFDQARAAQLPVGYAVIPDAPAVNLSNLDRWYERDAGTRTGPFTLYRLRPRR
ncbi:MAG TPA: hypothetical protein VF546_21905 [Pyrinomonadaceae bacterium]|jgi:hypothetical protein